MTETGGASRRIFWLLIAGDSNDHKISPLTAWSETRKSRTTTIIIIVVVTIAIAIKKHHHQQWKESQQPNLVLESCRTGCHIHPPINRAKKVSW